MWKALTSSIKNKAALACIFESTSLCKLGYWKIQAFEVWIFEIPNVRKHAFSESTSLLKLGSSKIWASECLNFQNIRGMHWSRIILIEISIKYNICCLTWISSWNSNRMHYLNWIHSKYSAFSYWFMGLSPASSIDVARFLPARLLGCIGRNLGAMKAGKVKQWSCKRCRMFLWTSQCMRWWQQMDAHHVLMQNTIQEH